MVRASVRRTATIVFGIIFSMSIGSAAESEKKPAARAKAKTAAKAAPAKDAKAAEKSGKASKEVAADAETVALLDKLDSMEYRLEKAGAKRAECKGAIDIAMPGQPASRSDLQYVWDAAANGGKGKVTFSVPAVGAQIKALGGTTELDEFFRGKPWRETYAGCCLELSRAGGKTTIKVAEGQPKDGITSLTVDASGLPAEQTLVPKGAPAPITMAFTPIKFGDKFSVSKIAMSMDGVPVSTVSIEFADVKGFHAPAKVVNEITMMGQTIKIAATYGEWRFNDDVTADAKAAGRTKDAGEPKAEEKGGKKPAKAAKKSGS